jgi:uncharacterized membrane protein (UPF0136 family)
MRAYNKLSFITPRMAFHDRDLKDTFTTSTLLAALKIYTVQNRKIVPLKLMILKFIQLL